MPLNRNRSGQNDEFRVRRARSRGVVLAVAFAITLGIMGASPAQADAVLLSATDAAGESGSSEATETPDPTDPADPPTPTPTPTPTPEPTPTPTPDADSDSDA